MAFTYDPTTDRGLVRLLIGDRDTATASNQVFTDAEVDAFLTMDTEPMLAGALALEAMAVDQALILKKLQVLELSTDGPAVAASLREAAQALRDRYYADQDFDYAEWVVSDSSFAEVILNDVLRSG